MRGLQGLFARRHPVHPVRRPGHRSHQVGGNQGSALKLLAHLLELAVAALAVPVARLQRLLGMTPTRITIVGWWGSETVGDEAILGQLLHECSEVRAGAPLSLVSFNVLVSRRTLLGLGRTDV